MIRKIGSVTEKRKEGVKMEAGEVVQLMKLNDFTQFKNQDVLTIIKGCHEKTRSTFFGDAEKVADVDKTWVKVAINLLLFAISQTGNNIYGTTEGIRDMKYKDKVGRLFEGNTSLWKDVFQRYLSHIGVSVNEQLMESFYTETSKLNFIMGMKEQQMEECIGLCFALVRIYYGKAFSLYCQKWEDVLGNEIVSSYTGEQTLYEYVESPVLEDAVRLYVENAIHTVTDSKNWVSQEKRNRGIATATHDVFVVHEVREVYHSEYDQGRAVWSWLQDQEVKSCIPEMKNIPDCHIHNQSYGNWYDAPRPSGGCVTGDTKICLSDGREIPISQIREGMQVLSENGTVSVTSDEKVINRHISCLYGINDIPPFMSLEHAVLTEEGWKSLDPETTNSINPFYHAAKLQVGDVVYTLKGKEIVREITKQYADIQSMETFTGYDLHFRQGYQSYYANGILVLLNYPEITIARIKRVLDRMSFQKQKRFRHMIEQNYDIFSDMFGELSMSQLQEEVLK